jgi:hypothetical protein
MRVTVGAQRAGEDLEFNNWIWYIPHVALLHGILDPFYGSCEGATISPSKGQMALPLLCVAV